jgi:hypothetical protein
MGRPKTYKDENELEKKINDYFNEITITNPVFDAVIDGQDEEGKPIYKQVPRLNNAKKQIYHTEYVENPSILGMCRYLEINRSTLNRYESEEQFCNTIKRAKERVEEFLENQLYRKEQVTGVIFNLKNNFGWKDKQEIESNNTNDNTIHVKLEGELGEWAK